MTMSKGRHRGRSSSETAKPAPGRPRSTSGGLVSEARWTRLTERSTGCTTPACVQADTSASRRTRSRDVKIRIEPLTADRWDDLVELFERPGASIARGCYCMYYRRSGRHDVPAGMTYPEANKRALKKLVDGGVVPGLIGYENGRPIGWVSLGPRDDYAKLRRSPVMKPVDERSVWSIICFFVDARARHRGVAGALLEGALAWARAQGATLVEAYP